MAGEDLVVELRRVDEHRLCAFVRLDQGIGIAGIGPSVHEALQALAKELVSEGVWIEVAARREWQFEPPPLASMLPHSDFGDPECCGLLQGIVRGDVGQIVCNECGAVVRTVPPVELQKAFREMELELDVTTDLCPRCGSANIFPASRKSRFTPAGNVERRSMLRTEAEASSQDGQYLNVVVFSLVAHLRLD